MNPIVIYGPQGSGKTTTARAIAAERGRFTEIVACQLGDQFWPWMSDHVKSVIIDGPFDGRAKIGLRKLLGEGRVLIDRRYEPSVLVEKPALIICVEQLRDIEWLFGAHRFVAMEADLEAARKLIEAQAEARKREAFDTLPDDYEVN